MIKLYKIMFGANSVRHMSTINTEDSPIVAQVTRSPTQKFFDDAHCNKSSNPNVIAKRQALRGGEGKLTLDELNSVLPQYTTSEVFEHIQGLTTESVTVEVNLPLSTESKKVLKNALTTGKTEATGIYLFRDVATDQLLYIGSSKRANV
jgi:hypothetical protein